MALRKSEDVSVHALYADAPDIGLGLLSARYARAYVDLNRARDELDPALIEGAQAAGRNPRVASGLGVIPRIVGPRAYIQKGKITQEAAEERLTHVWDPYHTQLRALLNTHYVQGGQVILLDLHSMPQAALDAIGQPDLDIVLGDLHGQACAPWITEVAEAALIAQGFRVQRNIPFAGAYNMQQYGRPRMGRHALQIEIARRLYMDEGSYDMTADFAAVRARLARALADIRAHAVTRLGLS